MKQPNSTSIENRLKMMWQTSCQRNNQRLRKTTHQIVFNNIKLESYVPHKAHNHQIDR